MRIKLLFICAIFILFARNTMAQQDAQFSQYMFNSLYYNPGYAGLEGLTRFSFIHRTQWLFYKASEDPGKAPQSQVLSASTPLPFFNKKTGAGIYFVNDELGPLTNLQIQLSGAYHIKLGEGILGIGLRGGLYSQRVKNLYRVVDKDDPIYLQLTQDQNVKQTKPDMGAGLYYNQKKYYAGVSFGHLTESRFSYGTTGPNKINSKLANHLYITGGYHFEMGPMIKITPSIIIQTDLNQLTYNFGGIGTYNDKFWVGVGFRESFAKREVSKGGKTISNDDVILYVGVNVLKNKQNNNALRIGYAFDYVTSGRVAKKGTSHEILVSYIIPTPWELPKPKVRTPRYRHDEN